MRHNEDSPGGYRSLIRVSAANPRHANSVLTDARGQITLRQLPERLADIQNFFADLGMRPGQCVTVELTNNLRDALVLMALLDAGYDVVPLPAPGLEARNPGNDIALPTFSQWVVSLRADKAALAAGDSDLAAWLQCKPDPAFLAAAPSSPGREAQPGARAYWRTSGSLGLAKLAAVGERQACANLLDAQGLLGLTPDHRVALPVPIFHRFGCTTLLTCIAAGASVDIQERGNLLRYLDREDTFNPNVAFVTPSFCEILARGRRSARRYEFMVCGGDRVSEATFERSEQLHGVMRIAYGSTEMGCMSFSDTKAPAARRRKGAARLLPGIECRLAAPGHVGAEADNAGELQVRQPDRFDGYVDLAGRALDMTPSFDDAWYRTGDLAALDDDGALRVLGRSDLCINRNGLLLPLADVEGRLNNLAGVLEAAASAGRENIHGRELVAFCVLIPGIEEEAAQLQARLAGQMPSYARPDLLRIMTSLPRLASGKVDRRALAVLAAAAS